MEKKIDSESQMDDEYGLYTRIDVEMCEISNLKR